MVNKVKKSVQEIVQKDYPEFADAVAGLSGEEINQRLAQLAKDTEEVQEAKDKDECLIQAQSDLKLAAGPYRDMVKVIRLKSKYLVALAKEKGAA